MGSWNDPVADWLRRWGPKTLREEPGVWVVGGAIRDILLGREPREIDIVVEGDAVALARRLGVPDVVHERFGTAGIADIDLASARTETYARPGALPTVQLGATIAEDLRRRDFTVNALAVRLANGEGVAYPGALEDLETKTLRVLHPRSFVDDPTRAIRLRRYAARLGFEPDLDTEALARAADFSTVSGDRLGNELRLLLKEPREALLALEGERFVHPAWAADPELLDGLEGLTALGACLLDADDVAGAMDRLAFPAAERDVVVAVARGREIAAALQAAGRPSEIADLASRQPEEALDVAARLGADEEVGRWRTQLRHIKLLITGDDLLAAGLSGPAVGAGLRAALTAARNGDALHRDAQLQAALRGVE
jgi:tRNA nucleotidyltransferase (CCA-adding enzyme)